MTSQMKTAQEETAPVNKNYIGFFVVAVASLIGGIFIFALIVIPQLQPATGVPRDVQLIFTQVFSQQTLIKQERGKYTPALIELDVDQDTCRKYSCLLTLEPSAQEYLFRLTKDEKTWGIQSKSPVPHEIAL